MKYNADIGALNKSSISILVTSKGNKNFEVVSTWKFQSKDQSYLKEIDTFLKLKMSDLSNSSTTYCFFDFAILMVEAHWGDVKMKICLIDVSIPVICHSEWGANNPFTINHPFFYITTCYSKQLL